LHQRILFLQQPGGEFLAGEFIHGVAAIGNPPITKAIGNLMEGLADVKEVAGTIIGAFFPAPAKAALKVKFKLLQKVFYMTKSFYFEGCAYGFPGYWPEPYSPSHQGDSDQTAVKDRHYRRLCGEWHIKGTLGNSCYAM
jgi:hypothetical protein